MIYLDNAATTPMLRAVAEAMQPFMYEHYGNPSAIHALGRRSRVSIENARKNVAGYIKAATSEIFFTSGGTEANNTVLLGAVRDLGVKHIVISNIEHHCILHFADELKQRYGVQLHFLEVNSVGRIDYNALDDLLQSLEEKTLVSLMHANNEIGTMIDLDRVAEICQTNKAYFHSDTVQTVGHFEIDVSKTPIDFLVCSAHKLHGPKGVGFLYIRSKNKISPLLVGGAQERNMRAGTENITGIIGLEKAVELAHQTMEEDKEYILTLKNYLRNSLLAAIPEVSFNGDVDGESLYTVLSVNFKNNEHTDLLLLNLDIDGICASGGSACSSGTDIGSHVINALGAARENTTIRFSFSKLNTIAEIDELVEKLCKILKIKQAV